MEVKRCERCQSEKESEHFYRRPQKNDPEKRMKICSDCYKVGLAEGRRQREEQQRRRKTQQEAERLARMQEEDQKRQARQRLLEAWYEQQPDRQCIVCKQILPASAFSYSQLSNVSDLWVPHLHKRCKECHDTYLQHNKSVNPPCRICKTPTRVGDFLPAYYGYRLDLIRICCRRCIPRFEELTESEQRVLLKQAMTEAYGKTSVIYALQYDDTFPCQHIGRTKRYTRRMDEYKRNWHQDIRHHFVLQQLSFGPLSIEYEIRWMLYALKQGWTIDNFDLLEFGKDRRGEKHVQAKVTEAVQTLNPFTTSFEIVRPLIRGFTNTIDAEIVNWYCTRYHVHAYPKEEEIEQRLILLERLHGLKRV